MDEAAEASLGLSAIPPPHRVLGTAPWQEWGRCVSTGGKMTHLWDLILSSRRSEQWNPALPKDLFSSTRVTGRPRAARLRNCPSPALKERVGS